MWMHVSAGHFTVADPHTTREYGPLTRPVNTDRPYACRAPVLTGRVGKKHCTTMHFANTAHRYGCSVRTIFEHGRRPMAWEHGPVTTGVNRSHSICTVQEKVDIKLMAVILLNVELLTDFQVFFTCRFIRKSAVKWLWNIPPHLKRVATLPREMFLFKNCHVQR